MKITERKYCTDCKMLDTHCLCDYVTPKNTRINLIVLQHPQEARHHKNTVQLLKLNIPNCQIFMGDDDCFDLDAHLEFANISPENSILLYPQANSEELSAQTIRTDFAKFTSCPELLNLIVIDSNWKKANKIFLTNHWLHQLSSYHLVLNESPSIYAIRKKRQAHFRSTLEATVIALNILEDYNADPSFDLLNRFCELKKSDIKRFANKT